MVLQGPHDGALQEGIGRLNRSHLGRDHEQPLCALLEEIKHVVADARAYVDQNDVRRQRPNPPDDPLLFTVVDVRRANRSAGASHQMEVRMLRGGQSFVERIDLSIQQPLNPGPRTINSKQDVLVGGSEIAVDQDHPPSCLGQRQGQIRRDDTLAYPAFASSHRDDALGEVVLTGNLHGCVGAIVRGLTDLESREPVY